MTEDEARRWLRDKLNVPRETLERIDAFLVLLREEAARQNLVAQSTLDCLWSRHVVDSAQLLPFAPGGGAWIDLGSGAGFPGLIAAILRPVPVILIESRRKRIKFLQHVVDTLGLGDRVAVEGGRAELLPPRVAGVISARAFAPLEKLLSIGSRFADQKTIWVLPKGRSAQAELDAVRRTWQGVFRIEQSVTDPDSSIIVAEQVRPRAREQR
jgi:16S rRNA (guanine527-N7)-methyltransferase